MLRGSWGRHRASLGSGGEATMSGAGRASLCRCLATRGADSEAAAMWTRGAARAERHADGTETMNVPPCEAGR
jgi:hypothetical protein